MPTAWLPAGACQLGGGLGRDRRYRRGANLRRFRQLAGIPDRPPVYRPVGFGLRMVRGPDWRDNLDLDFSALFQGIVPDRCGYVRAGADPRTSLRSDGMPVIG